MARRGPKGPTHERSRDELEEHLRRQVAFLGNSAAAVDAGNPDEAIRLAVTVRVLCHDGTGVALLKLLGLNKRLRYVNTAHSFKDLPPGSFVHDFGLARVRTEFDPPSVTAYAPLDDLWEERTNPLRFEDWWTTPVLTNQSVIARARPGFTYSRKNVVLALANKDGAHVDPQIPAHQQAFIDNDGGIGWTVNGQQVRISRYSLALAWMRQIAYEVQQTLEQNRRVAAILNGERRARP